MPGHMPSRSAHRARAVRHYRAVLQHWLWLLVLCTLLGGAGAYLVSKRIHPEYRATTLLVVDQQAPGNDPYTSILASDQLVTTYVTLISQPVVLERAAQQVHGVSAAGLNGRVSASVIAGTQIIEVEVQDTSPTRAASLANAIVAAFIDVQRESTNAAYTRLQQAINQQLTQVSAQIESLNGRIDALRAQNPQDPKIRVLNQQLTDASTRLAALQSESGNLLYFLGNDNIRVYQPAIPPTAPDYPKPVQNAAIGGALGLAIAAVLVLLLEFFDDRIRTPEQAGERLGLPLLGSVGTYDGRALLLEGPASRKVAMDFRALVANLELAHLADSPRTIAVTSAVGGEGRTAVAINLAAALARSGKRVLLVDADLHQPRGRDASGRKRLAPARAGSSHLNINELLKESTDLPNPFGLSLILTRQILEAMPFPSVGGVPGLYVLPAGPGVTNASELLRSSRMGNFLHWLANDPAAGRFDVIVLDTPPADSYPDAALLARCVDATVLVVDAVRPGEEAVQRVKDIFQRAHVRITGVVLNRTPGQVYHDHHFVDDQVQASALQPEAPEARQMRGSVHAEENGWADSPTLQLRNPPHGTPGTVSKADLDAGAGAPVAQVEPIAAAPASTEPIPASSGAPDVRPPAAEARPRDGPTTANATADTPESRRKVDAFRASIPTGIDTPSVPGATWRAHEDSQAKPSWMAARRLTPGIWQARIKRALLGAVALPLMLVIGVAARSATLTGAGTAPHTIRQVPRSPAHPAHATPTTSVSVPAQAEQKVFVGSHDGAVYALAGSDGHLIWRFGTGAEVESSPAYAAGIVYFGSDDHYVYAVRATDHHVLWRFETGSKVLAPPAIADGVVYAGSNDDYLYALRASDGTLRWRFKTGNWIQSRPAVANGVVVVGSMDHKVYALRVSDGALLWWYQTGDSVSSSPTIANGVLYIGSADNSLYALGLADGALRWRYTTGGSLMSSPTVDHGTVYVGSFDGAVYALRASDGTLRWRYQTSSLILSSPAVVNGTVYVGSNDDSLYALRASDGTLRWRYATHGPIASWPAIADGTVYIGSTDHSVYALDAQSGHLLWSYATGDVVNSVLATGA